MSKIKDLDKKVRTVLADDEQSRNSDIRLTQIIWWRYYNHAIFMHDTGVGGRQAYVKLSDLFDLPREDNIKRIRAKIQNEEKLFVPTDPNVAKKRGWLEDEWRGYVGGAIAGVDHQTL